MERYGWVSRCRSIGMVDHMCDQEGKKCVPPSTGDPRQVSIVSEIVPRGGDIAGPAGRNGLKL